MFKMFVTQSYMKTLVLICALCVGLSWCSGVYTFVNPLPIYYLPLVPKPSGGNVCYFAHGVYLGCFNNNPPFQDLPLPFDPRDIRPGFYLFTRENQNIENVVKMNLNLPIPPEFKTDRETKIIIHGFLSDWTSGWMHDMKDELLSHGDYNVILVDWEGGAKLPLFMYENAASNTRVVSAYLAKLMDMVADTTSHDMSKVHCIGHSLGAQTCGFTGKRVRSSFARISGLDPAGPNFKDKPKEGRLDVSDAAFVDNIHSNGEGSYTMDFGIGQQTGDVDFIPNGGGIQPGCYNRRKRSQNSFDYESSSQAAFNSQPQDQVSCSHSRAYLYYIESINSDCPLTAVPCPHMRAKSNGDCASCSGDECQRMGYHSITRPGRGVFFVKTNSESPFCIN